MTAFENKAPLFLSETGSLGYLYAPQCQVNPRLTFFLFHCCTPWLLAVECHQDTQRLPQVPSRVE